MQNWPHRSSKSKGDGFGRESGSPKRCTLNSPAPPRQPRENNFPPDHFSHHCSFHHFAPDEHLQRSTATPRPSRVKMASSLRQSAMLATRLAASRAQPTSSSRTFTTALALRNKSNQKAAPRVNPLLGNTFTPPAPEPTSTASPAAPSRPSQATESSTTASSTLPPPPPPPAAEFEDKIPEPAKRPEPTVSALSPMDITSLLADKATASLASLPSNPMDRPKLRSAATVGRTVFVKDRVTPTSAPTPTVAFRVLDRLVKDQKVRNKYHSQRFHERPGLRRKRLKSERWRSRFKTGFKATVSRVLELKKQGW